MVSPTDTGASASASGTLLSVNAAVEPLLLELVPPPVLAPGRTVSGCSSPSVAVAVTITITTTTTITITITITITCTGKAGRVEARGAEQQGGRPLASLLSLFPHIPSLLGTGSGQHRDRPQGRLLLLLLLLLLLRCGQWAAYGGTQIVQS